MWCEIKSLPPRVRDHLWRQVVEKVATDPEGPAGFFVEFEDLVAAVAWWGKRRRVVEERWGYRSVPDVSVLPLDPRIAAWAADEERYEREFLVSWRQMVKSVHWLDEGSAWWARWLMISRRWYAEVLAGDEPAVAGLGEIAWAARVWQWDSPFTPRARTQRLVVVWACGVGIIPENPGRDGVLKALSSAGLTVDGLSALSNLARQGVDARAILRL